MAKAEEKVKGNGRSASLYDWEPVKESGEHKSSGEIEHDIEETRHSMDLILDALSGRFSSKNLADRVTHFFQSPQNRDKAKERIGDIGENISESFAKNPLPAILMASGAVWMIWQGRQEPKQEKGEKKEGKGKKLKEKFSGESEKLKGKEGEFKEGMEEKKKEYSQRSGELKQQTQNAYKRAYEKTDSALHENPLLFGASALLGGVLLGLLLPETQKEKEIAGEKSHEVIEKVKEKGVEQEKSVSQKLDTGLEPKKEDIGPIEPE
ncbi:hypothetical protein CHISP_3654 [Chitinispirillum alkaliphilum]|nr:hypothetical protein CHISP_3654 [Chitinispirillum alkaliphilum]